MATVRILVGDVERALRFYRDHLGFAVQEQFGPVIAIVSKGDLTLWLSGPQSSADRAMADRAKPAPGGGDRFVVEVDDIEAEVGRLKAAGIAFRNAIVTGPGGSQALAEDGEGNVVELFEPKR